MKKGEGASTCSDDKEDDCEEDQLAIDHIDQRNGSSLVEKHTSLPKVSNVSLVASEKKTSALLLHSAFKWGGWEGAL